MENPAPIATVTVVLPPAAESLPASEEAAFVSPDAGAAASDEPPPHAVQLKTTAMTVQQNLVWQILMNSQKTIRL